MTNLGKVGVIVAARMLSTRLPGKALLPLNGMPMILFLLRRLRAVKRAEIVLATTKLSADDELTRLVEGEGVPVFRGADSDVVARYVEAARFFGFDTVARVTGDCPFVNAELVDWCLSRADACETFDVVTTKGKFPVGLDVEIYRARRMAQLHAGTHLTVAEREHLTLYFYDHQPPCVAQAVDPKPDWCASGVRFTVDTQSDYEEAKKIAGRLASTDANLRALVLAATA